MKLPSLLCILLFITSCNSEIAKQWTKPSYTGSSYSKIVVVAITDNTEARNEFESRGARLLSKKGINAIAGMTIFPEHMSEEDKKEESIIKVINDNKVDGALTVALIDEKEAMVYSGGSDVTMRSTYGTYGNYISQQYETVYDPGELVATKTYVLEAVFHDLRTDKRKEQSIVWRAQSEQTDPTSLAEAAEDFMSKVVYSTLKSEIIKK
ncbi:MAG: hypothetical protein AAGG59_08210 [Bacteroidota bacterium]